MYNVGTIPYPKYLVFNVAKTAIVSQIGKTYIETR